MNNKIIPSSSLGYLDNRLHFHHTPIQEAIGKISTPFYLYSKNAIQDNLTYFRNCAREEFSNVKVHYAMKANSNAEILKLLASLDAGADIVSLGEYKLATNSGIAPSQILFSGVGKTEHEIEYIISHSDNGIKSFNVESLDELELLQEISKKYGKVTNIAFRLNPNVSAMTHKHISTGGSMHKFGMSSAEIQIALAQNFSNLKLIGLSIHIGSQLKNFDATKAAIEEMLDIINKNNLHELDFLDFGGGLGIFYGPHDKDLSSAPEYFANISRLIKPFYLNRKCPEIIFEPGRFITGNAGILVTKVIRIKDNGVKSFAILDAGMTELIRPALYDAYHEILPLRREQTSGGDKKKYDFVGPVCETGDYFARDRESSIFDKNDLFAIGNCGSYARSMASTYNTREIPAEYFIEDIIK